MLSTPLQQSNWFDEDGFASHDAWRVVGIVFVVLCITIAVAALLKIAPLALAATGTLVLFTVICPLVLTLREPSA